MSADEMFEKLGYKIDNTIDCEKERRLVYFRIYTRFDFDLDRKSVYKYYVLSDKTCSISMEELKAINKKCEELGWL